LTKEKNVVITNHENIFLQCRVKMRIVVSWQSPQRDAKDTNHISVWKPDVLIKISVLFHPGELHEQFQLEFIWNTCVSVTKKTACFVLPFTENGVLSWWGHWRL